MFPAKIEVFGTIYRPSLSRPLLGYVLKNYERFGVSRPTMNSNPPRIEGLPDTCKLFDSRLVEMTRELQEFWFSFLVTSGQSAMSPPELKNAWRSLIKGDRAFTNKHGPGDGYNDYINGEINGGKGVMFEPIITGGNVVEIIGPITNKNGVPHWPIRVIDATKSIVKFEWQIFDATISRREGYNPNTGKWSREDIEIPFDQLGGLPVPVCLFSLSDVNFIPADRVRVLEPDEEIPNPYNPPR